MTISPLNRKLLRDLLAMKGQALAIAMVVAAGVAMYVMYLSNFTSLRETRDALLRAAAIRRRLRLAEAGPAACGRRDRRNPRRLGDRSARGRHRHARHGPARRAGLGPAGVDPAPTGGRA